MENPASRFGQHLAHTEKKFRDRALKKLTIYLTRKKTWTELDWDKLWKALFYCMWMSDKRPVQEELATNLSGLIHKLPTPPLALAFAHSFFRTMHREWHGLDGLRLDKFYSLVRKFVRESVALLRVHDFDDELVGTFVTILSQEIVSQVPNGLRMHLADLYLAEIYNAAAKDVTTDAFVQLLEPFFTLLGSEYDKTVVKRVRELVFEAMVKDYKFGPQPEKQEQEKADKDETDEEQEEEEDKMFEQVDLAQVQHRIFALASADDTIERNRSALYTLYKRYFTVTHVDSMQAALEEEAKPKKAAKKEKKEKKSKDVEEPATEAEKTEELAKDEKAEGEKKKKKKSKKRKAKKEAELEAEPAVEKVEKSKAKKEAEMEAEPAVEKVEKQEDKEAATLAKKKAKKQKVGSDAKDVEMKTPTDSGVNETKKQKKQKKQKEEKTVEETPATPAKQVKEQPKVKSEKKESYVTVTKSGKKFRRCGSCGGFGKGLVVKEKSLCSHCERSQKTQKKKSAAASKKRKAQSQALAAQEEQELTEAGKKVTFGKSKALRHEVSVKRLKASAKRDDISKDAEGIKGVLKVASPSPVSAKKSKKTKTKGRKTAADFF